MWHVVVLLLGLLNLPTSQARFFTEGGSYGISREEERPASNESPMALARILDELQALQEAQQEQDNQNLDEQGPVALFDKPYPDMEVESAEQIEVGLPGRSQPEEEQSPVTESKKPPSAQKKGQFEFVEFVEPHAKVLKNAEILEKRAPVILGSQDQEVLRLFSNSSNILFIAAVTICCVASVFGVVGGMYYFNNVRKQRAEAFDDFTRYSPAGPGRDVLRKGKGMNSPITETLSGDDSLAYKAQLHHYAQTKQKIIGDESAIHTGDHNDSEDEAEDLEDHNFSVYECPGPALGLSDVEVQNPIFNKDQQQQQP